MTAGGLFSSFETAALDRVTEAVGTWMAAAISMTLVDIVRDETVSPALMSVAVLRAHLLGASAAIAAAEASKTLSIDSEERLVADCIGAMLAALADMRAAA